ncbi:hypothetical protein NHQ30_004042 [Ciborinia camelliae]|nr:hypothetical protein NHQ30_004042 [Ciborinia camelliae]
MYSRPRGPLPILVEYQSILWYLRDYVVYDGYSWRGLITQDEFDQVVSRIRFSEHQRLDRHKVVDGQVVRVAENMPAAQFEYIVDLRVWEYFCEELMHPVVSYYPCANIWNCTVLDDGTGRVINLPGVILDRGFGECWQAQIDSRREAAGGLSPYHQGIQFAAASHRESLAQQQQHQRPSRQQTHPVQQRPSPQKQSLHVQQQPQLVQEQQFPAQQQQQQLQKFQKMIEVIRREPFVTKDQHALIKKIYELQKKEQAPIGPEYALVKAQLEKVQSSIISQTREEEEALEMKVKRLEDEFHDGIAVIRDEIITLQKKVLRMNGIVIN